jgi:hypothetical protein
VLEQARRRILGDEPVVVVEAAAGCGKTHEAVTAAVALGETLSSGREVLLLTHTNAARSVFESRIATGRAKVRMQTIDSLALEVVQRYAPHLGLQQPVVPDAVHCGHPSFDEVKRLAAKVLCDAPAVAEGLAWCHPVILVDEHQDSSEEQHQIAHRIASAGPTRVRYFGDRLQSIYGFAGGGAAWDALCDTHDEVVLTNGHRWNNNAELRDWLADARRALLADKPIRLARRPECVRVHEWIGAPPAPTTKGHCPEVLALLRQLRLPPRTAVLVCDNAHGRGLVERLGPGPVTLYEGADAGEPRTWLEKAIRLEGDPAGLARLLAQLLGAWGPGVPPSRVAELELVCTPGGIEAGKRKNILPLVDICRPLYEDPTPATWLRAFNAAIVRRKQLGWRALRRDATRLLAGTPVDDDLLAGLLATARARSQKVQPPDRAVMTVHRAKGSEFDTVVLPYVSGSNFGSSRDDAKKLYVAITRPQSTLHLFLSRDDPSPHFVL